MFDVGTRMLRKMFPNGAKNPTLLSEIQLVKSRGLSNSPPFRLVTSSDNGALCNVACGNVDSEESVMKWC